MNNISIDSILAYQTGNPDVGNRFNRRVNTVDTKTYIGFSSHGVSEDVPTWFVQLITDDGEGSISIEYANNITWTDRLTADYI